MPSSDPEQHYRRLSEAVDLYLRHRSRAPGADGEDVAPAERIMAQHPELRDLLEPMLCDSPAGDGQPEVDSPRFFGDYELRREVGRGGMGVVYEALEVALQRRVALKVLPDHSASVGAAPGRIERFRREAAAAGRLQHPAIAAVHRVGEHDGRHFIAMEFVAGPNLATVVARLRGDAVAGPFMMRSASLGLAAATQAAGYYAEVASLVGTIAEALAYAHDHGVVHRDVKPHNILLGGQVGVKLVDFGLAKDLDREALTRTGDTAGTPDYMSPEQVRGDAVDPRTDVFSLGAVLYELLTWTRPFARINVHATLGAIVAEEPPSPRRLQLQTPRDLETICARAMEKDLGRRYPSAKALAEDLRRFRCHEPILATPPSAASRAVKLWQRNRAATLAGLFAVLALIVAPIGFALHFKWSRDDLRTSQRETVRQRDLASDILVEARAALDEVYDWLAEDRLRSEPGMADVRRDLLARALVFYERFRDLAGDEPSLALDALLAEHRLGRILYELGEHERADAYLGPALLETADQVIAGDRAFETTIAWVRSHRAMIAIATNRTDTSTAIAHEEAAIRLLEGLAPRDDDERVLRVSELAQLLAVRSRRIVEFDTDPALALGEIGRAIDLWQSVMSDAEVTDGLRMHFAAALGQRALLRGRGADPTAALPDCERAVALLRDVVVNRKRSAAPRRRLVEVLEQQGEVLVRAGRASDAVPVAQSAVAVARDLSRDYPEFAVYRFDHATALFGLARTINVAGDAPACLAQLELAWPIATRLADENPGMLAAAALVGNIAGPLAALRRQLGGVPFEATKALHERAVEVFDSALARHPDSAVLQKLLATALSTFGNELRHAGDRERAATVLARAIELHVEHLARHPNERQAMNEVRAACSRQVAVAIEGGQFEVAHAAAERLVEALPNDPDAHFDGAVFLARIVGATPSAEVTPASVTRNAERRRLAVRWLDIALTGKPELRAKVGDRAEFEVLATDTGFRALTSDK